MPRPGSVTERLPVANEGHPGPGYPETTVAALAAVRARLDRAYAMKAEAERDIKDLTLALIQIGREAVGEESRPNG